MRRNLRVALIAIGIAFALYHAARSLVWPDPIVYPVVMTVTILSIAALTILCLFIEQRSPSHDHPARGVTRLPLWAGVLAVVVSGVTPTAVALSVGVNEVSQSYATSYLGAIGALLAVVAVRRRALLAWVGIAALAVGVVWWLGPLEALSYGLIGSAMWVGVAQVIMRMLDRAAQDTTRLVELQQASAAWQAAQSVRRRERRVRVQFALQTAGPLLSSVISTGGALSPEQRAEARIAEGTLRDELRGVALLDDAVRTAIEAARRRGCTVTVSDEGGLEGVGEEDRERIRAELATVIATSSSDRLIVRSSRHETVAVTIVGRSDTSEQDDDDDVELWHEIAR